ncbi:MAG: AI-2E family transporter [Desulfatiglans sp.]|jgi:predicted PurR-regulated permease PerM|nr:AI-2E family transporter [Desulfatiglans sp.]
MSKAIDEIREGTALRFLVMAAAFVIVVAGMRAAQSILVPFLLSIFIAVISGPLLFWLHRKGLSIAVSLLVVVVCVLGIGTLIGILVGTSLNDFSQSLPMYQAKLQEKTSALFGLLGKLGITFSDKLIFEYVDPGAAMRLASKVLAGLGSILSNSFLILLTVIFILLEAATFPAKLRASFDSSQVSMTGFDSFMASINRYMVIKTYVSLATGALVAIWLVILGVDYPLLWGLLAFLLNYVPNIGSIMAAIPAVLLAFIQSGGILALLTAGGYLVFNIVMGSVIEPRFMGRGLGLSTLIVFLSLVFWGWVLGPVGMVLSIPLTMTLKIALSSTKETMWISTLLGTASSAPEGKGAAE